MRFERKTSTFVTATCGLMLCALCACQELLLPPPDDLEIPKVLKVPPVEHKSFALQAVLDGVLASVNFDERFCEREPITEKISSIRCAYQDGGEVSWIGELSTEVKRRSVLGRPIEGQKSDAKLHEIKLERYRFMAHVGPSRIAAPQTCRQEVTISGSGSFYGSLNVTELTMMKRILLGAGGVFQGTFNVDFQGERYQVEFRASGFYYHRDLTPLLINAPDDEPGARPTVQILQISLITSGRVKIDQQAYSYQDVYLETFNSEEFWDIQCDSQPSR